MGKIRNAGSENLGGIQRNPLRHLKGIVEKQSFEGFFVGRVQSGVERNEKPDKNLSTFSVPPNRTPETDTRLFSILPLS